MPEKNSGNTQFGQELMYPCFAAPVEVATFEDIIQPYPNGCTVSAMGALIMSHRLEMEGAYMSPHDFWDHIPEIRGQLERRTCGVSFPEVVDAANRYLGGRYFGVYPLPDWYLRRHGRCVAGLWGLPIQEHYTDVQWRSLHAGLENGSVERLGSVNFWYFPRGHAVTVLEKKLDLGRVEFFDPYTGGVYFSPEDSFWEWVMRGSMVII